MVQTVCVLPPTEDRQRLLAIVTDRNFAIAHSNMWSGRTATSQTVAMHLMTDTSTIDGQVQLAAAGGIQGLANGLRPSTGSGSHQINSVCCT